uniref:Putative microplusin n=1 Tax=Ixodes ricinus TaxID=34613 RepID=A0A6B0UDU8_IXORI
MLVERTVSFFFLESLRLCFPTVDVLAAQLSWMYFFLRDIYPDRNLANLVDAPAQQVECPEGTVNIRRVAFGFALGTTKCTHSWPFLIVEHIEVPPNI